MPRVGITRAYRYYADRFYLDRANRDTYLARNAAGDIIISGNLVLAALKTLDGVDLSVHAVDVDAHHAKYTDAEAAAQAAALIATHAALATAHQNAPALIATHATDDDAHHAKYTNAEAVAAVLAATKEFFVPVTYGTELVTETHYPVARCNAQYDAAYMFFKVPHDFTTLVAAEIIVIAKATKAAADWDMWTDYAAVGEAFNAGAETDDTTTYNVTDDELFAVDASGIMVGIAANDNVGLHFMQNGAADHVDVLGVRVRYS